MKKYFGTDGIRGVANKDLTPELCYKLGRVLGQVLKGNHDEVNVLIGRDTRISGMLLESALMSGLLSVGANVMRLGIITTPAVAFLTRSLSAAAGIMISASHNPYPDNGIKIFASDGYKLNDEKELEIEKLIDAEDSLDRPVADEIGKCENYFEGAQKYLSYLERISEYKLNDIKIALDCANGSTSNLAPHLFVNLGADVYPISNTPDGVNINVDCGSTYVENLQRYVVENGMDLGFAFDGDGDRLIAVDEKGNIVNGDFILYALGKYLKKIDKLNDNTIVSTVMSNLGFYKALEDAGLRSDKTQVGDRYVLEEMIKNNYNLGGEQSGHIIYLDESTTGDGMLSALLLVNAVVSEEKNLSELTEGIMNYPQVLKNIRVENKNEIMNNQELIESINSVESSLNGEGRVLVRPSGTEPLIRVMAEAKNLDICNELVDQIVAVVEKLK
ncbi:phosphoglucosamine mutase [Haloplasma contractile]|uniref:Phosphoglucosamine mutase n=1 Tax=Haloplasma contractile SSD-17B TaxID=1033810 RepID=F7PSB6_9MOLU|nr:phosphoglucosamine mutase [Haloplasma contractile]ERJ10906.1 Phosphoglucosamine mutase protein [Haloplasma contractile SSD-17B]